eukprot:scaffold10220_cov148-Cylindrotheca_fusiformis.AAC.6
MSSSLAKRATLLIFAALILLALRRQALLLDESLEQEWSDGDSAHITRNPETATSVGPLVQEQPTKESRLARDGPVRRKWAYAFVVGGCKRDSRGYKGFIYNTAVAAQILRESGSKADVVALIQMSAGTNETALPEEESKMLTAMNVKIEYLPKFSSLTHEVFYTLMLEKFRVLQMTQYSRVIFMDGDVMPFCSLDYLFELSEPESGNALLKENVVLSYANQPAHGGFFMLKPNQTDFQRVQGIIRETEEKALRLPKPEYWDPIEGWGHTIVFPDRWKSSMESWTSTNWSWHGVHADQGLLYHWTKYVKQSVTLIINRDIENWSSRNGTAVLESRFDNLKQEDPINRVSCMPTRENAPYHDFKHFTGKGKPWQQNQTYYRVPEELREGRTRNETRKQFNSLVSSLKETVQSKNRSSFNETKLLAVFDKMVSPETAKTGTIPAIEEQGEKLSPIDDAYIRWFAALDKVEKKAGVKATFGRFLGKRFIRKPPVGSYPKFDERINHIKLKIAENWDPYAK